MDTQELNVLLVMYDKLVGLLGVEAQVVVSTQLFPAGHLIIVADQAFHHGAICKLDYVVGDMNRYAVVGEK